MKNCSKCKISKNESLFHKDKRQKDGLTHQCKSCRIINTRKWQCGVGKKNVVKNQLRYQKSEKGSIVTYSLQKRYEETEKGKNIRKSCTKKSNHKRVMSGKAARYCRERRKNDVGYRILTNIRSRISYVLKGKKNQTTLDLLGCSADKFKEHLESQFQPGMTWENYGKEWEVDHIFPLSKALEKGMDFLYKNIHYTNTQPLWKTENRSKGNKILSL